MSLDLNKDVIEEIRHRCNIADVISSCGVQLKKSGSSSLKGLCPFHREKTPSFHVDISRQTFHCFGCGKGGDVFRFFMDKENLDFLNAAQILASRCGVIIPEKNGSSQQENHLKRNERDRLIAINGEFSNFFCRYLRDNPGSPAAKYLESRNIPKDVAAKFRIGAVPDSWTACREYGKSLGFSDNDMLTAGILRRKDDTGRIYDQFKGRLAFTIENEQGKPVGFSARTLETKPLDGRKYVNTPETPVFKKGHLLYALPQARQGIGKLRKAILCEGQLDAIAFHRAGFDCAVAPLGTAFTPDQARIIRRYSNNLILAFDADSAGKKAVLRAAEILLPLSVDLKVLQIPGGKDPDELFAHGGAEAVAAALQQNTVHWLEILEESLAEKFDMTSPVGRGQAAGFTASFLKLIINEVELEIYIKEAAKMLGISEAAMKAVLADTMRDKKYVYDSGNAVSETSVSSVKNIKTTTADIIALSTLLELAITDSNCGRALAELLPPEFIPGDIPLEKALNLAINAALNDEIDELHSELQNLLIKYPCPHVSKAVHQPQKFSKTASQKAMTDAVTALIDCRRRRKEGDLLLRMRSAATAEEKMNILIALQNSTQLSTEGKEK